MANIAPADGVSRASCRGTVIRRSCLAYSFAISKVALRKRGISLGPRKRSGKFSRDPVIESEESNHSPGHYSLAACALCEVVMTFFFIFIIAGSLGKRIVAGFAPIPIGLTLTLIQVTNTSVNPARSTGVAIYVGGVGGSRSSGSSGLRRSSAARSVKPSTKLCSRRQQRLPSPAREHSLSERSKRSRRTCESCYS